MSIDIAHYPIFANTKLVSSNLETSNSHNISIQQQAPSITRNKKRCIHQPQNFIWQLFSYRAIQQNKGLPQTAKDILLSSWSNSAKDRYASTYRKWEQFYMSRNINLFQPVVKDIVIFLIDLYERGFDYASICSV